MKTKFYLLISLILIAIVAITSYTPQAAQAEVQTQEDPVSEAGEGPSRPDADNQINASPWGYFNAVGINFVPHDSRVTYYNGLNGCVGSGDDGNHFKNFSIPVNVPDEVRGREITFTYRNNVSNPSNGPILVSLWRRSAHNLTTQEVRKYELKQTGQVVTPESFWILDLTFDTSDWMYWIEFMLPDGDANREFCGVQIEYFNPPLFPLALPMIQR